MSSSEGKGSQDLVHADSGATDSSEKVIDPVDLAAKLFRAERAMADAKDAIEEALVEAGILQSLTRGWEDWWHDFYDASIEIKYSGESLALTDEHLMTLHDMGFSRIWTHGSDGEKFYSTKPRTPGAEVTFSNEDVSDPVSVNQPKPSLLSPSETEES